MATAAYNRWVSAGRPYRLARPAAALQRALRARGLIVYDYPDEAHLRADPPEDHTPFAATGWPGTAKFGVAHAIDIMPRAGTAAGRRENAAIARRLIADRNNGVPAVMWIKYLNWTDENGTCRQERWMPNHTTRSSTDRGHIHVSARTDSVDDTRADGYDPLSTGGTMTDDYGNYGRPGHFVETRTVPVMVADLWAQTLHGASPYDGKTAVGLPVKLARLEAKLDAVAAAVGVAQTDLDDIQARTGAVTDQQVTALADRVARALADRPDTPLSDADVPTLVKAFKQAAREGTDDEAPAGG